MKQFLIEQGKLDARMSKEQEEYLEALQKKVHSDEAEFG